MNNYSSNYAPMNELAEKARVAWGAERADVRGRYDFQGHSGGVNARILFVAQQYYDESVLDTHDVIAANQKDIFWRAATEAGLQPEMNAWWNLVPVDLGERNGNPNGTDKAMSRRFFKELLRLMPNLEVIVGLGAGVSEQVERSLQEINRKDLRLIKTYSHGGRARGHASAKGEDLHAVMVGAISQAVDYAYPLAKFGL